MTEEQKENIQLIKETILGNSNLKEIVELFEETYHENVMISKSYTNEKAPFYSTKLCNILNNGISLSESETLSDLSKYMKTPIYDIPKVDLLRLIESDICSYYFSSDLTLIIYKPLITVTNENYQSVEIQDSFIRIKIKQRGTLDGTFSMLRSTYTATQLNRCYTHSHLPSMKVSRINEWMNPCLGRGPIRETCSHLAWDFDINIWRLFIVELEEFLVTESLKGGPYVRLNTLVRDSKDTLRAVLKPDYPTYTNNFCSKPLIKYLLNPFLSYYLYDNNLKFKQIEGNHYLRMTWQEYIIDISNAFMKWYLRGISTKTFPNLNLLIDANVINKAKIINKEINIIISADSSAYTNYTSSIGTPIINFNGKFFTFNILNTVENTDEINYILNPTLCQGILETLVSILNKHNNEYHKNKSTDNKTIYVL